MFAHCQTCNWLMEQTNDILGKISASCQLFVFVRYFHRRRYVMLCRVMSRAMFSCSVRLEPFGSPHMLHLTNFDVGAWSSSQHKLPGFHFLATIFLMTNKSVQKHLFFKSVNRSQ